jgi:FixJ family two-component response regulator
MTHHPPTVSVLDDDPAVLKAVERLLRSAGLQVAGFSLAQEFLERHDPDEPGCLVLDYSMPGLDGLQLQQALADRNCALPIVFLTGRGDIATSVLAMKRGAADFLTKPVDDSTLIEAVQHAVEQDRIERQARSETAEIRRRLETLTQRELEVLSHVIAGKLNKQIAAEIGTVEKTVKVHRARAIEKMRAHSLAELVRLSARAGITPAP